MTSEDSLPKVSIGMPAYNSERSIRAALDSLLNQSYGKFELIISDNHSSDHTADICREYKDTDSRVVYFRQNTNLGAARNFQFVKDAARGEYFMWAAADDSWGNRFVATCLDCLETHPRAVGAITGTQFGSTNRGESGSTPISSKWSFIRRNRFLMNPGPNARFYSLFRMAKIREMDFGTYDFHAGDWAFIFDVLSKGDLLRVSDYCGFFKDNSGLGSNKAATVRRLQTDRVPKSFPLIQLARHVLKGDPFTGILHLPALAIANFKNYKYIYW